MRWAGPVEVGSQEDQGGWWVGAGAFFLAQGLRGMGCVTDALLGRDWAAGESQAGVQCSAQA